MDSEKCEADADSAERERDRESDEQRDDQAAEHQRREVADEPGGHWTALGPGLTVRAPHRAAAIRRRAVPRSPSRAPLPPTSRDASRADRGCAPWGREM